MRWNLWKDDRVTELWTGRAVEPWHMHHMHGSKVRLVPRGIAWPWHVSFSTFQKWWCWASINGDSLYFLSLQFILRVFVRPSLGEPLVSLRSSSLFGSPSGVVSSVESRPRRKVVSCLSFTVLTPWMRIESSHKLALLDNARIWIQKH